MKQFLFIFLAGSFCFSTAFSQEWQYVEDFALGSGPHGVVVTADGKIWVGYYGVTDSIDVGGGEYIQTRPIWIYNPDGSVHHKIQFLTHNGNIDTLVNGCRGLSLDNNGNVLYSNWNTMCRINYQTYQEMNRVEPYEGSSITEMACDDNGFIYVHPVLGDGRPLNIYDSNFNFYGSVIDSSFSISRSLVVSPDGKDVYLGRIYGDVNGELNGIIHFHSDNGPSGPYAAIDTIWKNLFAQCLDWDKLGRLWVGTYWDLAPGDPKGWYALDPNQNWAMVDSIGQNAGAPTGDPPAGGTFHAPRGMTWSLDGRTAYTADFDGNVIKKWNKAGPANVDYSADLLVYDNCNNSINLLFGTAADATDSHDEEYDQYAPPAPPAGAFDARFHITGDDLLSDFRATNSGTIEWDLEFKSASGCEPATVQWNPAQLPNDGSTFRLVDYYTNGSLVDVDMRTNSSYVDDVDDPVERFKIVSSFQVILVFDNCDNSIPLIFGTAPDATDGYDAAYDQYAPPAPPAGAFDARFHIIDDDLLRDFRAPNTGTIEWDLEFRAASGCEPATIQWDPSRLPDDGSIFRLVDYFTNGTLVNIDMRTDSSYVDYLDDPVERFKIVNSLTEFCDVALVSGWNMIGVSVDPLDPVAANLFPNMIPPLYGFNGSYVPIVNVECGAGYWERNTGSEIVSIEGLSCSPLTISLMNGWNMIAGPNCTVALGAVDDPGEIIIPGTLFGFEGVYVSLDSIQPGNGYWLRTNAAGDITLSCPTQPAGVLAKAIAQLPQLDQFSRLMISDATGAQQTLYLNVEFEDEAMLESYSLPPLPPAGLFDARFSSGYRISQSDEDMIHLQASVYPVSISISNAVNDSAYTYLITEIVGNKEVAEQILTAAETVEITNTKVTLLKISKKAMLALPTVFAVSQNYPNPFNPTTEIKYALPENEKVTIVIYNQLGQKVKTLLSQYQDAGYHKVIWNSTNESGNRVASGIYFYTVTAGKNSAIKKMILLK